MKYQKPDLQHAGMASKLIQTKLIIGMDESSNNHHTAALISALEAD